MTRLLCIGPTAAEVSAGETRRHLEAGFGVPSEPDAPIPPGEHTGPDGAGGYVFQMPVSAVKWRIVHGLGLYPDITVQDSGGADQVVVAEYPSANEVLLTFTEPTQGFAWLNKAGDV